MSANRPACEGKAELFEATDVDTHRIAAHICDTCPAIEWCRDLLAEEQRTRTGRDGLRGTWAGVLFGKRGRPIPVRRRRTTSAEPVQRNRVPGHCVTCSAPIEGRRIYCEPCRKKARIRSQRNYESATRDLDRYVGTGIACPWCEADAGFVCISRNGNPTASHKARLNAARDAREKRAA